MPHQAVLESETFSWGWRDEMSSSKTENNEVTAIHCDRYYNRGTYSGTAEDQCSTLSGLCRKGFAGRVGVYQLKKASCIKVCPYIDFAF